MKLEEIDRVIRDSLQHGNNSFNKEQIEILSETIKAAFEEYHKQTK